jgi:diguanylate cyclase (GGDEF)-like protein
MTVAYSLNTILSSCFILILIIADYLRRYNTDPFQRKLYIGVLVFTFIAVISDFLQFFLSGKPGKIVCHLLYMLNNSYFIFQNLAYYFVVVFIDYLAYKDMVRTKKFILVVSLILSAHAVILTLNVPLGFYFVISEDNFFVRGDKYYIRLIISYFAVILAIGDIIVSSKHLKQSQVYLIVFFAILSGTGAALDLILNTGNLIWPCLCAAFLYFYFFIIRADLNLDSLTGIGNRYSFDQFINKLTRQNTKQSYSIIMMDMNDFKKINDTYGHLEGDNALRDAAAIIKKCIRHSDFAARYGGDEFILAAKAEYNIEKLMERIQAAMEEQNNKNIHPYKLKISYGYDVFTTNSGQSIEEFLTRIDGLMYKHKAEQRRITDRP